MAIKHFDALMGGTALVTTLIGLILTSLISSGFEIKGLGTWLMATVVVWIVAMLAGVLLPAVILKKKVNETRERRSNA